MTIVATGLCVSAALEAAELLKEDGVDAEVINIHTIKPIDEDLLIGSAGKTGKVVTVEEHSIICLLYTSRYSGSASGACKDFWNQIYGKSADRRCTGLY